MRLLEGVRVVSLGDWHTGLALVARWPICLPMLFVSRANGAMCAVTKALRGCLEVVEDEILGRYRASTAPLRIGGGAPCTRRARRAHGMDIGLVFENWGIK